MRAKQVNLLTALIAVILFSFSCFCISRMTQIRNQLINCRNHILEFKESFLRLQNKTESNRQQLMEAFSKIKYDNRQSGNASVNLGHFSPINIIKSVLARLLSDMEKSGEKEVNTLDKNKTVSNTFEVLKFFLPHLKKVDRIYPNVIISKKKKGVSFALGISTVKRRNHSYLKQTLTSLISRMTLLEQKDSVMIISIADSNKEYSKSVVDMIRKTFKRQVKSGSLEVISIPAFFYPDMLHAMQSTEDLQTLKSWRMKQVLDFCFLMLYAQPKAMYYLQLEDDIIAKKMYFTKITDFVHSITSNNWFYIEFSVLGFIGKLFKSEDLTDFIRFFLMFHKDRPIDWLLEDIFKVKVCNPGETFEKCVERNKQIRIQYRPSLFQHVGIQSSHHGTKQYLKTIDSEDQSSFQDPSYLSWLENSAYVHFASLFPAVQFKEISTIRSYIILTSFIMIRILRKKMA